MSGPTLTKEWCSLVDCCEVQSVKLYLISNSVLYIVKNSLLLLCGGHECCNAFITSVTIHYLNCIMRTNYRSPRPPGSWPGKQGCPSKRCSICLMLNCSQMSTPDGISGGLTAPSSCTACSYMPLGRDRRRQKDSFAKADGKPYPSQILRLSCPLYNWWAIGPLGRKSGSCTTRYTY